MCLGAGLCSVPLDFSGRGREKRGREGGKGGKRARDRTAPNKKASQGSDQAWTQYFLRTRKF